ncbi:MAG: hypothetical protein WBH57_13925 [Anaerolineae bacterium]
MAKPPIKIKYITDEGDFEPTYVTLEGEGRLKLLFGLYMTGRG